MTSPSQTAAAGAATALAPGGRAGWWASLEAVTRLELSRARVVRVSLLFVATFQSVGILLLLRGVVDRGTVVAEAVVAGCTVLVGAFTALNLLAQRLGELRGAGALDRYALLPAPGSAVVLGHAAAFIAFTLPGAVATAVLGVLVYGLPAAGLALLAPVLLASGLLFAGLGALVGLLSPRAEIATVVGQLGMSAVIFLGVVPPQRLPELVRSIRAVLPPAQAVDALAAAFRGDGATATVVADLASCAAWGAALLALAGLSLGRAVRR